MNQLFYDAEWWLKSNSCMLIMQLELIGLVYKTISCPIEKPSYGLLRNVSILVIYLLKCCSNRYSCERFSVHERFSTILSEKLI